MKTKEVKVVQDQQNPVPTEILAESIRTISEGIRKLRAGPLNERCLVLLIQESVCGHQTGRKSLSRADIKAVLDATESLKQIYLKGTGCTENRGQNHMEPLIALMVWLCGSQKNVKSYTVEQGGRIEVVCKSYAPSIYVNGSASVTPLTLSN